MKNRPAKYRPNLKGAMLYGLLVCLIIAEPILYGFAGQPDTGKTSEAIHITADRLVTDINNHSARFSGNVHAVQGNTQISADDLTVDYQSDSGSPTQEDADAIKRLSARGHVRITFDNRLAVSEQAVYITSERKLILEGPGSKVTNGRDEIVGTKITYLRDSGLITVEGDGQNGVTATLHADQKDLN